MNKNSQKNSQPKDVVFFQLFMSAQKSLYAFILASVHNYADTNDILQETATVLWRKFDEFNPETSFVAWGISIARNQIRNYFNRHRSSRIQFDNDLLESIEKITMAELNNHQDRVEALKSCFEKLSESNRSLLNLRYSEGMTVKSIAFRLGKPIQGMYKIMARVQDALLRCIEQTLLGKIG